MDTRTPSPTPEETALAAIEQIGPRCFKVTGLPAEQPLCIYVLGCQGEKGERQQAVAHLMNDKAAINKPAFLLFLGDNVYGGAVESTQDERFDSRYHHVYNLPNLASVPGILILGNHDANLENWAYTGNTLSNMPFIGFFAKQLNTAYKTGKDVEKFEVAHTYQRKSPDFYQQDTLPIAEFPKWNMPYYFCSYDFINSNTQLFCLNSNTFVNDFMSFWENEDAADPVKNQALWFDQAFFKAQSDGRATMVALHNPLLTSSKRALPHKYDAHLYMTTKQIQKMNYILDALATDRFSLDLLRTCIQETDPNINAKVAAMPTNGSHADMLAACLKIQKIKPDVVFTAHDHALVYNKTDDLCQVISGAGGSTNLMRQESHVNDANQGCFLNEPGFVAVTCDAHGKTPNITFDFHTADKHLQFTNASHYPVSTMAVAAAMQVASNFH